MLEPEERARIKGLIVNKFRGDKTILDPGVAELERRGGVPVAGVIPYMTLTLDDEDSLTERFGRRARGLVNVGVVQLPHVSNFTDFDVFEQVKGVAVTYVKSPGDLRALDLLILPGSKNTIEDLRWLKEHALADRIREEERKGKVIFGICGGYQMLGRRIFDPSHAEAGGEEEGLGLLPVDTILGTEKIRRAYTGTIVRAEGILRSLEGLAAEGYEIHMGQTTPYEEVAEFISGGTGYCRGRVCGCYIHGIFDRREIPEALIRAIAGERNKVIRTEDLQDYAAYKETCYDQLAGHLRQCLDLDHIREIMGLKDDDR